MKPRCGLHLGFVFPEAEATEAASNLSKFRREALVGVVDPVTTLVHQVVPLTQEGG